MKKFNVTGLLQIPEGSRFPELGTSCLVLTREKINVSTWKWHLHTITPPSGIVSKSFPVAPVFGSVISYEAIGNRLWIFGQVPGNLTDNAGGALIEYDLATLAQTRRFDVLPGDNTFRAGPLAELQTGEVVATWYKHITGRTITYGIGIVRNNALQIVNVDINGFTGSTIPSSNMALAQHPRSKNLWQFSRRDGGSSIQAISLDPTTLKVNLADNAWISSDTQDQVHAPELEFPDIFAVENTSASSLDLIYGNKNGRFVSTAQPVQKYTFSSICRMGQPESKRDYTFVPVSVERVSSVSLLIDSSGRFAVVQANQDRTSVVGTRGVSGNWDESVTLATGTANFGVGPKTQVVGLVRSETSTEIITEPFIV